MLSKKAKEIEQSISEIDYIVDEFNYLNEIFLISVDESNNDLILEINDKLDLLYDLISRIELSHFFLSPEDKFDAFLDIHPGSGGIDAQDLANILLNMYISWGNRNNFNIDIIDINKGDISGIKSSSIKFCGKHAFGLLKFETGIHRFVRKSPFDSGNKRHTSFISVFVYPDIPSVDNDVILKDGDLKIDTFRSGGAGGQHVNKTDSAVRITHLPTNIVVQCQSNRSQHKNKEMALRQLRCKLNEIELNKKAEVKDKLNSKKSYITWGNQIRSYILDKNIIKDLRTNLELNNVKLVLDGHIDYFIFSMLAKKRKGDIK